MRKLWRRSLTAPFVQRSSPVNCTFFRIRIGPPVPVCHRLFGASAPTPSKPQRRHYETRNAVRTQEIVPVETRSTTNFLGAINTHAPQHGGACCTTRTGLR